jgi:hypothetical protein
MDIQRKIEIAEAAITSIGTHDDEDAAIVQAALNRLMQHSVRMQQRVIDLNARKVAAITDMPVPADKTFEQPIPQAPEPKAKEGDNVKMVDPAAPPAEDKGTLGTEIARALKSRKS